MATCLLLKGLSTGAYLRMSAYDDANDVQSAKAALAAAVENTEGVREAVAAKEVLDAAQKSSTAAWRAHSVSQTPLFCHLCSHQYTWLGIAHDSQVVCRLCSL